MRDKFTQSMLDQININDVIAEDTKINNNKARCPFPDHDDANPSLTIYPPDGFYCFGCQRGETAIDYLIYRDDITPNMAIRYLCDKYNIPMPEWSDEEKKAWEKKQRDKNIALQILGEAAQYYHSRLIPQRREYLHQRGLTDDTIDSLKLGYADGTLYATLKQGIEGKRDDATLLLSGLFVKFGSGSIKDSFQRRYMFPYWKSARVVYFIGLHQ